MSNLFGITDQIVIGFFSIVILYYSFKSLNNCTKETKLIIRIPLIMYLTGSVGTLLLLSSGLTIDWSYGFFIIATAFHLAVDRRKAEKIQNILTNFQHGKH